MVVCARLQGLFPNFPCSEHEKVSIFAAELTKVLTNQINKAMKTKVFFYSLMMGEENKAIRTKI